MSRSAARTKIPVRRYMLSGWRYRKPERKRGTGSPVLRACLSLFFASLGKSEEWETFDRAFVGLRMIV